jgi:hypothetical protein
MSIQLIGFGTTMVMRRLHPIAVNSIIFQKNGAGRRRNTPAFIFGFLKRSLLLMDIKPLLIRTYVFPR